MEFEGMLGELPLQLHDSLGCIVKGVRVVKASSMFVLLGSDVISPRNGVLQKRGERTGDYSGWYLQLEAKGIVGHEGVWYNAQMLDAEVAANSLRVVPACVATNELLVGAEIQDGDVTSALSSADLTDLTMRWLYHKGPDPVATVQVFLRGKAKGFDVLNLKYPRCQRKLVEQGHAPMSVSVVFVSGHRHAQAQVTQSHRWGP